jgi:hypothetical protein
MDREGSDHGNVSNSNCLHLGNRLELYRDVGVQYCKCC